MDNVILIKRRLASSPLNDIPVLENGELAFNEKTYELYYGAETRTISIGGSGAFVSLEGTQTIIGDKKFSGNTILADTNFLTGSIIDFGGNRIRNLGAPISISDAATKVYVDDLISEQVSLSGTQVIPGAKTFSSNTSFLKDLTVFGSLSVFGDSTLIETTLRSASAMQIINTGTGPALRVSQTGANDIAIFYHDENVALIIKDGGNVGIGTNYPNELLTVAGNISAANFIYGNQATFATSISAPSLSGTFYGNLKGTFSGDILGEKATFTTSVSSPALSGSFYGNLKGSTAVLTNSVSAPALSGTLYGNVRGNTGSFVTSVIAPTLSGTLYGDVEGGVGSFATSVIAPELSGNLF